MTLDVKVALNPNTTTNCLSVCIENSTMAKKLEKNYKISYFYYNQGIVRALREFQQKLIEGNVSIYVRRAGPNYQEGLRIMRELGMYNLCKLHNFGVSCSGYM